MQSNGQTIVVGGIAALVFLRASFTSTGLLLTLIAVFVAIFCVGAYAWAKPDDGPPLTADDPK